MVQWELSGLQSMNYGFLEAGMHFRLALLTSSLRATTVCRTSPTSPAVGKLQEDRTGVCHCCSLCTTFQSKLILTRIISLQYLYHIISHKVLFKIDFCILSVKFLGFSHAPQKTKLLITPWLVIPLSQVTAGGAHYKHIWHTMWRDWTTTVTNWAPLIGH